MWKVYKYFSKQLLRNKVRLLAAFLVLLCLHPAPGAFAQSTGIITITGTVKDTKGQLLSGVVVRLKGSPVSASSDNNGRYTIKVPNGQGTLVFSCIGFQTQEQPAGGRKTIDVSLSERALDLEGVVVVGYGTTTRKDLTGSVSSVKVSELQKAPVRSFEEALAGRVAGVQVSSVDGQPGSAVNIVIRGNNSITQDNSPLYIIDGFPIENPDNNAINPAEIETIDVLKDASALAVYGSRAANGVIIITTKRGKEGTPTVSYSGYSGFQQVLNKIPLMDSYEFVKYQLERNRSTSIDAYLDTAEGVDLESYRRARTADWQDAIFRTAPMQNHHIAVRGGNKTTKYSISASATGQKGVIIASDYNRYQGRLVLDQDIGKKLKVGINTNYSYLVRNGTIPSSGSSSQTALMFSAWGYRPVTGKSNLNLSDLELDDEDLIDLANDSRYNPILSAQNELRRNTSNVLSANAYAEYTFNKYLKLRVTGGLNRSLARSDVFNNTKTRGGSPNTQSGRANGVNGSVTYAEANSYVNENTLTYARRFKKHSLNVLGGFTLQGANRFSYGAGAVKIPDETKGLSGIDDGTPMTINSSSSSNTLTSFLMRTNYNYDSKYLLTLSFRADGSSKFEPGNQWGFFPSAAVAWSFGREAFMEGLKAVSNAKLRVSHGYTGNNRVDDFAPDTKIEYSSSTGYTFDNNLVPISLLTALGNRNLKWETVGQTDIGLDLGFFNQRLTLEMDVYSKTTYDLLLNAKLPRLTGFADVYKNIGKVQNQGLEITLNSVNIDKKAFQWNTSFNISFNRNKVLELAENQESLSSFMNWDGNYRNLPLYIAEVGQPIAMLYGYIWEGNYQYEDFDVTPAGAYTLKKGLATNGSAGVQPGDIKYRDINGDGQMNTYDQVVIGNPTPKFTGGFSNNFSYKGFDLNVFLQFTAGGDIFNANRIIFEGGGRPQQNMYASYVNRWTPENPNNEYYRTNGFGPHVYSSRVVEDGSFLRIKTVQLAYNIPATFVKRIKLRSARVYASGQNLFTWTKYQGFDPEVSSRYSALTPGFDYSVYPRARTVTFGLDISL